jgi:glutaredoxin 3
MSRILLYTTPFCGYCRAAKRLLAEKTLDFEEIDVSFDRDKRAEMLDRANGQRTVPQIFIHGRHVRLDQACSARGKLETGWPIRPSAALADANET